MIPFSPSTEESALVRGGFFRRSRENKGKTNMKQLKFMLAAATAVGIAAAAQAADPLFTDTFEDGVMPAGYSYVPVSDNDNDNESAIVDNGYNSSKALQVNTGTNPFLRALDWSGSIARPVPLSSTKSVYIDTMVKFTVTPAGDNPTPVAGDKLMMYVEEVPSATEGESASNKLVIWAAADDAVNGGVCATKCVTTLAIDTDKWYRLYVESEVISAGTNAEGEDLYYPCFKISLAEQGQNLTPIASSLEFLPLLDLEDPSAYFPSLEILSAPDGIVNPVITHVGFAGEGKVDNLAFGTVDTVTGIDFTLTLGTGVSAVTYTLAGETLKATGTTEIKHDSASSIAVTAIDYVLGYKAGTNVAGNYNADVTIDATPIAFNEGTEEGSTATTATDLGITGGTFAAEGTTTAELKAVYNWGSSKGVSVSQISGMNFTKAGDPVGATDDAKAIEEAYLLNCSPAELETAKDNFKFEAFDPLNPPTAAEFEEMGYNGTVVIEGATTLDYNNTGMPDWGTGHEKPAFYRARLKFGK